MDRGGVIYAVMLVLVALYVAKLTDMANFLFFYNHYAFAPSDIKSILFK